MKNILNYSIVFILFLSGCGDVKVTPVPEAQTALGTVLPEGIVCSRGQDDSNSLLKVVFVVDMSLSNIGEFKDMGNGKVKFDSTNASDVQGQRFNKIKEFINSCGSANPANQFKVVGFSSSAIKSDPAKSGCSGGFFSKENALAAVENLKGLQQYNLENADTSDFSPSMQTTTYQDGLECARDVVLGDIGEDPKNAKNSNYLIFFLTDGKPTDNCQEDSIFGKFRDQYGTCCAGGAVRESSGRCCAAGVTATRTIMFQEYCCAKGDRRTAEGSCEADPSYIENLTGVYNPTYESILKHTINLGTQKASSIRVQPVYYGKESEKDEALKALNQFAEWGDSQSSITLANAGDANFCQYATAPVKTEYQISEFNVINLTAVMKDGVLRADSDIDGISDKEDKHPTNARSNAANLLDGICLQSSNSMNCKKPSSCDANKTNSLHLSECDLAALGLSDYDGIDSDKDSIPDLIESLRGTLPLVDDAMNNLDGDGLNNLQEIHTGRQVDSPDDGLAAEYLVNWNISKLSNHPLCPSNQQSWKLSLRQIPTVPTMAYKNLHDDKNPVSRFKLSHEENENIIFIYYISDPVNNKGVSSELYGTIIKIPYSRGLTDVQIDPSLFQKLGSLTGTNQ